MSQKYVAHSETPSKAWNTPSPAKKRDTGSLIGTGAMVITIGCIACVFVAFTAAILNVGARWEPQTARAAVAVTATYLPTNTPPPNEPTKGPPTPYPTYTAEPKPDAEVVTNIEYVQVTRQVEVTRQVVITAAATPNATATVAAQKWAASVADDQRAGAWEWLAIVSVSVLVILLLIIFGIAVLRGIWQSFVPELPTILSTVETVDDITGDARGEYFHPKYGDYRPRVWHFRKKGLGPIEITKKIWPENLSGGGSHYRRTIRVLVQYDPMGKYGPTTPPPEPTPSGG